MMKILAVPFLLLMLVGGCAKSESGSDERPQPPWVKTVALRPDSRPVLTMSGTIRARYETPIAFQVSGRILVRDVDAGQHVEAGQRLFRLDPQDLDEAERAAASQLAGAEAALETETKVLARRRNLRLSDAVSQEELERAEFALRDAVSRRDAARANLAQARNARTYTELRAKRAGVLIEVTGEPGQVVPAGQAVAVLAQEGEREIEVFLADSTNPSRTGTVRLAQGGTFPLVLREVVGAADPVSRTWRARYRVLDGKKDLPLGTVVHVSLAGQEAPEASFLVPVGALDERHGGPHVWHVIEGRIEPVPVQIVALDLEQARIKTTLPAEAHIVALGTHLLTPGMVVRERAP